MGGRVVKQTKTKNIFNQEEKFSGLKTKKSEIIFWNILKNFKIWIYITSKIKVFFSSNKGLFFANKGLFFANKGLFFLWNVSCNGVILLQGCIGSSGKGAAPSSTMPETKKTKTLIENWIFNGPETKKQKFSLKKQGGS